MGNCRWKHFTSFLLLLLCTCVRLFPSPPVQSPRLAVQTGHSSNVYSVDYSPDGRLLASGSRDETIIIWDAVNGCELRSLSGHTDLVNAVRFSPDGRRLASASNDHTIRLWDVATGDELKTLAGHSKAVKSVAFSPDGRTLVSGSSDHTIKVWDVSSGVVLRTLAGPVNGETMMNLLDDFELPVALSKDGRVLASGTDLTEVQLWDPTSISQPRKLELQKSWVVSLAFSPDGRTLATGIKGWSGRHCCEGWIKLWDVASGGKLRTFPGYSDNVSVAFSPDGRTLASGGSDETLRLRDVETGRELHKVEWHANSVSIHSIAFSPDGRTVAAAGSNATILQIDAQSGRELRPLRAHHAGEINSIAFTPDGRTLAAGLSTGTVKLWDLYGGRELRTIKDFGNEVWDIALSPDGRTLAAGTSYTTIRLKDVATGRDLGTIADHGRGLSSIAFSSDGRTLASTNDDYVVRVWDIADAKPFCDGFPCNKTKHVLAGHEEFIYCVAFSLDGRILATGSGDHTVKLWNVKTGREIRTLRGHQANVSSVAFSPDGRIVASGARDNNIKLWNVQNGGELRTLTGHTARIAYISFSPDGKTLASGSDDRTVRLWDVASGRELRTLVGHGAAVRPVVFSPDGRILASGGRDTTIKLWEASTGRELATLFTLGESGWVVADPNGRFDTSNPDEIKDLNWVFPDEPLRGLAPEVFMRDYYQPLVLPKLYGRENLPPLRPVSQLNRAQPLVEIVNTEPHPKDGVVSITVRVTENQSDGQRDGGGKPLRSGAYDLRLFRDARLVAQWPNTASASQGLTKTGEREFESWRDLHRIKLVEGQYTHTFTNIRLPRSADAQTIKITAYAFNSDRVKSPTSAARELKLPSGATGKTPRRAYIITMGVNANQSRWNLELAVSSAERVRQLMANKLRSEYQEIVEIPLYSDLAESSAQIDSTKARKAHLQAALDLLAGRPVEPALRDEIDAGHKVWPATPDDAVVVYIASHGYVDPQAVFHVIPFDTGTAWGITGDLLNSCLAKTLEAAGDCRTAAKFLERAISSTDLTAWWQGIDAGEMIMIVDSCYSGAISDKDFRPAPLGDPGFGQLSYDKGMRVLCAAQPAQTEHGQWVGGGEGRTLLVDALERFATARPDASLAEWLKGAQNEVPIRMRLLYPGMKESDVQLPVLFDFARTTVSAEK